MLTDEQARAIAERVAGPEGVHSLIASLHRKRDEHLRNIEVCKQRLDIEKGQLTATDRDIRAIEALRDLWGIGDLHVAASVDSAAGVVVNDVRPDIKEAMDKGLCVYQDRGSKKVCSKPLRAKDEKASGYCHAHMDRIGLIGEAKVEKVTQGEVSVASSKTKRARKARG